LPLYFAAMIFKGHDRAECPPAAVGSNH